jgi:hypothetical protein
MELDNIKKLWNEIDVLKEKQHISDEKIKEMLKNKGKTALSKLIRYAKLYSIAVIPLGLFLCLLSHEFFKAGGYYPIMPLLFLLICILLQPFEIYLYRLLKNIDFFNMTIKDVSERILNYQHLIQKMQQYGTIGFFFYLGAWYFFYYQLIFGTEIVWSYIIFTSSYLIFGLFLIPFLYKKMYYNRINKIKECLNEFKEFENSND